MPRYAIAITIGVVIGAILGAAPAALEEYMSEGRSYTRACLPGDECTMRIRPAGAPWLNITCELTEPPRCRDE
jgi:hypothetical protein